MVDILNQASELTGIGQGDGGFNAFLVIGIFLLVIFIAGLTATGTWLLVKWYQYKYKIVIFQRINGKFQETARRKARVIPVGNGGDQAILLNKPKKILPMPTIQSGKNVFNYFISDDGEWINFEFSDFDDDRRTVGSQFLDSEMRYARTSLQHMGDERYNTKGFWEKYGGMVAYAVLILVTAIGFFLIVGEIVEAIQTSNAVSETQLKVMESVNEVLGKLDNLQTGGSGLKPATTLNN